MKKFLTIIFCFALAACARNLDSNAYVSSDEAGIVQEGTILSVRQVVVNSTDKLEGNGLGMIGGAVAGGVAGSTVGGGSGKTAATAGGALAGAALGSLLQNELGKSAGFEYIIKLSSKPTTSNTTSSESQFTVGKQSIKDKLKDSISTPDVDSQIISVVQGTDVLLNAGQKVYVIYNSDRIRLVAAN